MEPPEKNSVSLGFPAMDWQGPAARRAGVVLLVLVCIALGIAVAGIPSSAGNPRLIVVQGPTTSSSTTTTVAESTTSSGPSTTFGGPSTTFGRGTTTTARRSPGTTARRSPGTTAKPTPA